MARTRRQDAVGAATSVEGRLHADLLLAAEKASVDCEHWALLHVSTFQRLWALGLPSSNWALSREVEVVAVCVLPRRTMLLQVFLFKFWGRVLLTCSGSAVLWFSWSASQVVRTDYKYLPPFLLLYHTSLTAHREPITRVGPYHSFAVLETEARAPALSCIPSTCPLFSDQV